MKMEVIDTTGMRAPQTLLEIGLNHVEMRRGDILDVQGDCPNFESAVKTWCDRLGSTIVSVVVHGSGRKDIRIRF